MGNAIAGGGLTPGVGGGGWEEVEWSYNWSMFSLADSPGGTAI